MRFLTSSRCFISTPSMITLHTTCATRPLGAGRQTRRTKKKVCPPLQEQITCFADRCEQAIAGRLSGTGGSQLFCRIRIMTLPIPSRTFGMGRQISRAFSERYFAKCAFCMETNDFQGFRLDNHTHHRPHLLHVLLSWGRA